MFGLDDWVARFSDGTTVALVIAVAIVLGLRHARSALQAYAIGLVHGMGGSAGVGVLLLATIHDRLLAVAALGLFACCTAGSMALVTPGGGLTLTRPRIQRSFDRLAPVLGVASLAFGTWYALGALSLAPY